MKIEGHTFPVGAKIIRDTGEEIALAGVVLEVRETTARHRVKAKQRAQVAATDEYMELMRLSISRVGDERYTPEKPYPDYYDLSDAAMKDVEALWLAVNYGEAASDNPLAKEILEAMVTAAAPGATPSATSEKTG